jgi:DNA repair protein RecN (Recombination protein N)
MLQKLIIENYALIDKLEISFTGGLTVITGETGAGKSILVGALSLILGERADTSVLLDPGRKCIVEGTFSIKSYRLDQFFTEHELDYDETAILRREISQNGKSRAFINDTPVNNSLLKELGDKLVNIHSQHSVITLNASDFQLAVLDNYVRHQAAIQDYKALFRKYSGFHREKTVIQEQLARFRGEQDYYQFLLEEFETANLREGEQEELEKRMEVVTHAEEIKTGLQKSIHLFSGDEGSIVTLLSEIISSLTAVSGYHDDIKAIVERIKSNQIDINDIVSEINHLETVIDFDPAESETLATRLGLIYHLLKKHQAESVSELLTIRQNIESKISKTIDLEEKLNSISEEISTIEKDLKKLAGQISGKRNEGVPKFEQEIRTLLTGLGMPHARFSIGLTTEGELTPDGFDTVRFLFSANKGVQMHDISKVASGGELSRLMLSIKSMITQKNLLPTVIFDEIDSGVSGDIAGKVGNILVGMSERMQVVVITHLPQIAGKGRNHYWVYKKAFKDTTRTLIKKLNDHERVDEIAKMLSNETVTEAAVLAARDLLGTN